MSDNKEFLKRLDTAAKKAVEILDMLIPKIRTFCKKPNDYRGDSEALDNLLEYWKVEQTNDKQFNRKFIVGMWYHHASNVSLDSIENYDTKGLILKAVKKVGLTDIAIVKTGINFTSIC